MVVIVYVWSNQFINMFILSESKNNTTAYGGVMTRSHITNCLMAAPFIRGNPTVRCVNGNVGVLSPLDNVVKVRESNLA